MSQNLAGKRIAILATDGFEQVELTEPQQALRDAGAVVQIIGLRSGRIQGMNHDQKADQIAVDAIVTDVKESDFAALVLPGGVANPDELRTHPEAVAFVRDFFTADKPVAAICHGPWTLIEADAVRDHTVTSWPSLRTDLVNAGARWVDEEVVVDRGLVTSRKPQDLPAFCKKMVALFSGEDGINVEAVLQDPAHHFSAPADVVDLPDVADADKLRILEHWERDARALSVAEEEGLAGGEQSELEDIRKAVHAIDPPGTEDSGSTGSKHGG